MAAPAARSTQTTVPLGHAARGAVARRERGRDRRARARRHSRRQRSSSIACCRTRRRARSAIGAASDERRTHGGDPPAARARPAVRVVAGGARGAARRGGAGEVRSRTGSGMAAQDAERGRQAVRPCERGAAASRQRRPLTETCAACPPNHWTRSTARRSCSSAAKAASARQRSRPPPRCGSRARIRTRRVLLLSTDPAHSLGDVFTAPVGDSPARDLRRPANSARSTRKSTPRARCAPFDGRDRRDRGARRSSPPALGAAGMGRTDRARRPRADESRAAGHRRAVRDALGGRRARRLRRHRRRHGADRTCAAAARDARRRARVGAGAAARAAEVPLAGPARAARGRARRTSRNRSASCSVLLRDSRHTRFIVVTRAAEVPRRETERLLRGLRRLHLATPAVVVNAMTLAPGRCARCRATAAAERRQLRALARACGGPRAGALSSKRRCRRRRRAACGAGALGSAMDGTWRVAESR